MGSFAQYNVDLSTMLKVSRRLLGKSIKEMGAKIDCSELEMARLEKKPLRTPCFMLTRAAEALGPEAVDYLMIVFHKTQMQKAVADVIAKYQAQRLKWSNVNVSPIRDLSIDEISLIAAAGNLGMDLDQIAQAKARLNKLPQEIGKILSFPSPTTDRAFR